MKTFLTIDPGVNIGVALWDYDKKERTDPPLCVGSFKPVSPDAGWENHIQDTHRQFLYWVQRTCGTWDRGRIALNIQEAFIEYPAFFDTHGGTIVAKEGSLVKLAFSVGWLASILDRYNTPITLTRVQDWKGQVKKATTRKRIVKRLGPSVQWFVPIHQNGRLDEHGWDAVGIGLWARGHL